MIERGLAVFEFMYAALYGFTLKRWGDDEDLASYFTAVVIGSAQVCNCILFLLVLSANRASPLLPVLPVPRWVFVLPVVGLLYANVHYFVYRGRYKSVVEKFARHSAAVRRGYAIAVWAYVLASYAIPLLIGIAMDKAR